LTNPIAEAKVSVIIPTYFRYDPLRAVLEALCGQTLPPDEVIVVDQAPEEVRPPGFYSEFADRMTLKVFHHPEPSISVPRNIGASIARNELMLFLDDDILIPSDLIQNHVTVMSQENVDVLNGASTRQEELPTEYPWDTATMDPVRLFMVAPNYRWSGMMIGVSSLNFMVKRSAIIRVGGFDPHIPRMVDFEIGYRLFRSGAKIFYSDIPAIRHLRDPQGGSRKSLRENAAQVSAIYMHLKHFPGWTLQQFMLRLFLKATVGRTSRRRPWRIPGEVYRVTRAYREAQSRLKLARKDDSSGEWQGLTEDYEPDALV
jgi:GT2 family glycosyltransferase